MGLRTRLVVLAGALVVDAVVGAPMGMRVRHPVEAMGWAIGRLDLRLNRGRRRRLRGAAALGTVMLGAAGSGWAVSRAGRWAALGGCAWLLAQRSLVAHVGAVARADGIGARREAVARIVGRDVAALDEAAVARAAIESLAENFSDGVVAPALWFAVAGLPGMAAYKAVNTADSMIGHLTPRHAAFGWAAARLDDLVNLPASRLAAVLIGVGSGRWRDAMRAVRRDAGRHRSPNAGWPEAAMAGGLGLRLAGPRRYGGVEVADHWMGDGRAEVEAGDVARAIGVGWRAWGVGVGLVLATASVMPGRPGRRPSS